MRFTGKEISNLDAISLSNYPKLSDNPRIKTVEYTVVLSMPYCPNLLIVFVLVLATLVVIVAVLSQPVA